MKIELDIEYCEQCPFVRNDNDMWFRCSNNKNQIVSDYDRDVSYNKQRIIIPSNCKFKNKE